MSMRQLFVSLAFVSIMFDAVAESAAVDISPIVERIPNGVYVVTGIVSVTINDGPCSDFMINVPYPEPSQYQDIEWVERPPSKLLKTYSESGDRRFFFLHPIRPPRLPPMQPRTPRTPVQPSPDPHE